MVIPKCHGNFDGGGKIPLSIFLHNGNLYSQGVMQANNLGPRKIKNGTNLVFGKILHRKCLACFFILRWTCCLKDRELVYSIQWRTKSRRYWQAMVWNHKQVFPQFVPPKRMKAKRLSIHQFRQRQGLADLSWNQGKFGQILRSNFCIWWLVFLVRSIYSSLTKDDRYKNKNLGKTWMH